MRTVIISGSPRKNGSTAKAIELLDKTLTLQGHDVEKISIVDYEIKGCIGCYYCMAHNDKPNCSLKDDALYIFSRLLAADFIVYASPLYWFDFTAQFKAFFDRQFCLTTNFGSEKASSFLAGKPVALLMTCLGPVAHNVDLVQDIFDRSMAGILKCNVIGKYILPASNAPDFENRAKEEMDSMAQKLRQHPFCVVGESN